jgi:hypothetical protein
VKYEVWLFLLLNLLVFLVFLRFPKSVSKLEIFGCWLVSIIYHEDWLTISSINMELIKTEKQFFVSLIVVLNRLFLCPMTVILLLELLLKYRSPLSRASLVIIHVALFSYSQNLSEWANLYHHLKWSWWWSVIIWSTEVFLIVGARQVFKTLLKGVERT